MERHRTDTPASLPASDDRAESARVPVEGSRWRPAVVACLAAGLMGCSIALDFGPGALLPSLDAGIATPDVAPPDVAPVDVPSTPTDDGCGDGPCACPSGRGDCDHVASNGCETDLTASDTHCGTCDRACMGAHACTAGVCGAARCTAPEVACGMMCANTQSDARHCGACGASCGPGATRCCQGVCTSAPRCP